MTVGGKTSGIAINVAISGLKRDFDFTSHAANGVPIKNSSAVVIKASLNVRKIAASSDGLNAFMGVIDFARSAHCL